MWAASPPAKAHPGGVHAKTASLEPPAHRAPVGRSVGSPTDGHLIGGAHLAESTYLRVVPIYAVGDARWGLEPLVGMIDRAARAVRKQFTDSVLSVGHLSRPGGGEIDRHASHESGRDADLGFYVKNQLGKPLYADHFVAFKGDGTASTWPGASFDDARNWALIASIVGDASAHVTHVFVAAPLRARLLQYAEKIGASLAIRTRAAELMAQPRGALPHDDHFHVRIACPAGMDKCIEQPLARKTPHRDGGGELARSKGAPSGSASGKPHSAPTPPPAHAARTVPSSKASEARPPEQATKSEELVPSLAPMVQGLDSAVIPMPFGGVRPEDPSDKPAPPPPAPIDDPDGVLDRN